MTVKDIVQRYCPSDVPVYYHNDKNRKKYFSTCIRIKQSSRDNDEKDIGIYLPNASIDEAFSVLDSQSHYNTEIILDLIRNKICVPVNVSDQYLIVLFSTLHEFGHWDHFISSELSGMEYTYKYYFLEGKFEARYREECSKASSEEEKLDIYKRYSTVYRKLPMEAMADKYALSMMQKIFNGEKELETNYDN